MFSLLRCVPGLSLNLPASLYSAFLWQSVLGSAYSLHENGSYLSFELKAFHFLFSFLTSQRLGKEGFPNLSYLGWPLFHHILSHPFLCNFPISSRLIAFQVQIPDFGAFSLGSLHKAHVNAWSALLWKRRQQPSRGAVLVYMDVQSLSLLYFQAALQCFVCSSERSSTTLSLYPAVNCACHDRQMPDMVQLQWAEAWNYLCSLDFPSYKLFLYIGNYFQIKMAQGKSVEMRWKD